MRKMRNYRDYLIEKLSDHERAISYLQTALEEYEIDGDSAALHLAFNQAVEAQGGVQKFALKTHSTPQAVSDALLSKNETQIAELLKKQVLAKRGEDKDIAQNGPVPKGWREVQLGEFMEFKNGLNTKKENYGSGVKFVNVMDVFSHNHLYANDIIGSVQVNEKQRVDYSVKYGDVLFNRTSETFEEIAMASVYLDKKEIIFGGFVIRGRQKTNILIPEYSAYCFQAHTVRRELIRRGQGAVRANIGQKDLSKIPVIIPPVNEQKAIASLLETWDTAIEKTKALIEAKEKRFKWLLKTLISDQQDNPEWQQVKLGEISTCYSGGTPSTQVPEYYDGEISFINSGDLNQRHIKSVKGMLSILGVENSSAKFVKKNTLLMALYGATAGVVAITHIDAVINQAVLAIVVKENYDNNFIFFGLEQIKNTLVKKYRQGGQPNLSAKIIKSIKLRLPSLPEQKRIANILYTAKKEVESLNQLAEQYRTQKRGLMQKLLTGEWRVSNQ